MLHAVCDDDNDISDISAANVAEYGVERRKYNKNKIGMRRRRKKIVIELQSSKRENICQMTYKNFSRIAHEKRVENETNRVQLNVKRRNDVRNKWEETLNWKVMRLENV